MSNFLNYKNNRVTIDTYRLADAAATDIADIICSYDNESEEILTANLDIWIDEELSKIDLSGLTIDEARDAVFGEWDFLELTLNQLNIDISEYPDLRDPQNDLVNDYFCE